MLKFSKATDNAKLKGMATWLGYKPMVYSFSLPSGYTCPFALDCLSKADRVTGKVTDGKDAQFRCFSASQEAAFSPMRAQRWHNFDILRKLDPEGMVEAILEAMPEDLEICRIHVGGDFFNQAYFDAWLTVATLNPDKTFYAYTKSNPYWVARLDSIPDNFILTGSKGGRTDALLDEHSLKVATVVFSLDEAGSLPIDHDEYYALNNKGSFALLIHGTQPRGSQSASAMRELKAKGVKYAYSRKAA